SVATFSSGCGCPSSGRGSPASRNGSSGFAPGRRTARSWTCRFPSNAASRRPGGRGTRRLQALQPAVSRELAHLRIELGKRSALAQQALERRNVLGVQGNGEKKGVVRLRR